MSPVPAGRPEASAAIWDWRAVERHDEVSASRARRRGAIQAAIGGAIGTALLAFGPRMLGLVVVSVAGLVLLAALLSPTGLYAAIERAFEALGRTLARGLMWLLLPLVFYLFFLPFGALFRRGRRDAMRRFFEAEAESYWSSRARGRAGSSHRERQY